MGSCANAPMVQVSNVMRQLLRVPHARVHHRAVGGLQSRQPAQDGQVGLPADERTGELRGAAGQDLPVRGAHGLREHSAQGQRALGAQGQPRGRQEGDGVLNRRRRELLTHACISLFALAGVCKIILLMAF